MERHRKIILVFILIFVQAFLIQHVHFCPERSIIFGRSKTIATAKAEVEQVVHECHKSLADKHPVSLFLSTYITTEKRQNHNIYTEKLVICNNIEKRQLARSDLHGEVPIQSVLSRTKDSTIKENRTNVLNTCDDWEGLWLWIIKKK